MQSYTVQWYELNNFQTKRSYWQPQLYASYFWYCWTFKLKSTISLGYKIIWQLLPLSSHPGILRQPSCSRDYLVGLLDCLIAQQFLIVTGDLIASHPARYQVTLPLTKFNRVNAHGPSQSVLNLPEEQTIQNLVEVTVHHPSVCPVLIHDKYPFI